ncbi:MAG: cupin domain-containing protein [Candidatus Eisenbacteria bacterium]|nr:cupin domain-containing protein [Candidatus Eisenbacteria bacterium]
MKVIHFKDAERYEPEKDWRRVSICSEKDISIEHIVKPPKHSSPRHEHPYAQVLVVLKGKLAVTIDKDGERRDERLLGEGDAAYIEGNESHVVTNPLDTPSVGLDIFVPGRSFDFWLKRKQS